MQRARHRADADERTPSVHRIHGLLTVGRPWVAQTTHTSHAGLARESIRKHELDRAVCAGGAIPNLEGTATSARAQVDHARGTRGLEDHAEFCGHAIIETQATKPEVEEVGSAVTDRARDPRKVLELEEVDAAHGRAP